MVATPKEKQEKRGEQHPVHPESLLRLAARIDEFFGQEYTPIL
jgi:hypothetical protein